MEKPGRIIRSFSEAETTQQKIWLAVVGFLRSTKFLWLYFAIPAGCLSIGYVLFYTDKMDAQTFFTYGGNFYSTVGLVLTLWIMRRISKKAKKPLIMGMPRHWKDVEWKKTPLFFLFGLSTAWALSFVLTLVDYLLPWALESYTQSSTRMYSGLDLGFTVLTTVLLAPIVEEVIFRGHMLDTLLETFEERTAIWVCTATFALCHGNVVWMVYTAVMGWLLAQVSIREEGIFEVCLMHIGFNLPSALIVLLETYCPEVNALFENLFFMICLGGICIFCCIILGKKYLHWHTAAPFTS